MRVILCTEEPTKITFRLTMVATVDEFERLRDQLEGVVAHPGCQLKYGLTDVISQARKMFWSADKD